MITPRPSSYMKTSVAQLGEDNRKRAGDDGLVVSFDRTGTRQDLKVFGTFGEDWATSVGVSGAGAIYAGGITNGRLGGRSYNGGERDAFLRKLEPFQ